MVFYVSSPKYQPMIKKIMDETDQIYGGSETGSEIYLKKYVKENISSFEQTDIFLIDMNALKDTDEEVMQSIESLRIMDYDIRFIILAPYKTEGDKFLRDCFYAGIYDIIITDNYLEMSQQLAESFSCGMRYKDALRFRDAVEENGKQEALPVQKILVGIAGAAPRMGSTHNSIVAANYLRKNNQMTAILEMNGTRAFEKICEAQRAKMFEEGYFSLRGVDYYPECGRERVTAISGKLYNFIILDFGDYRQADKILFNQCGVRMIFAGTKPWEMDALETVFQEQEEDVLKAYHFCFLGTTSGRIQKEIMEHMKPLENVWFPRQTEDPFGSDLFPEAEQIFKEYLKSSIKPKEKKRFFGRR